MWRGCRVSLQACKTSPVTAWRSLRSCASRFLTNQEGSRSLVYAVGESLHTNGYKRL